MKAKDAFDQKMIFFVGSKADANKERLLRHLKPMAIRSFIMTLSFDAKNELIETQQKVCERTLALAHTPPQTHSHTHNRTHKFVRTLTTSHKHLHRHTFTHTSYQTP